MNAARRQQVTNSCSHQLLSYDIFSYYITASLGFWFTRQHFQSSQLSLGPLGSEKNVIATSCFNSIKALNFSTNREHCK